MLEKDNAALAGAAKQRGEKTTTFTSHCDDINLSSKWIRLPNGGVLNVENVVEISPELHEMDNGTTMLSIDVLDSTGKTREIGSMVFWSHSNYVDGCEEEYCEGLIKMFELMKPGQILRTFNHGNHTDYIPGYPKAWAAVIEG